MSASLVKDASDVIASSATWSTRRDAPDHPSLVGEEDSVMRSLARGTAIWVCVACLGACQESPSGGGAGPETDANALPAPGALEHLAPEAQDALRSSDPVALERALAEDDPRYRPVVREAGVAFLAPGEPDRVIASFDAQGAHVRLGESEVHVSGRAIGRAGAMRALASEPTAAIDGAEVRTARGSGVVEWWRSLPSGLEHGFTIAVRPEGEGALLVEVGFDGLVPRERSATAVDLEGPQGQLVARYADLFVVDAAGAEVPARMTVSGDGVRIEVDDGSARYPLVVDPTLGLFLERTLEYDEGGVQQFDATSTRAVSMDTSYRRIAVYTRSGTSWTRERLFTIGSWNPVAVAMDGSGSLLLVGETGLHARVFTRSGTTWTEGTAILPPTATVDAFANEVALSADGQRAFIGQPRSTSGAGDVHVFLRNGSSWTLEQSISGGGTYFGSAIAASDDGSRVIVRTGSGSGAANVYVRSGSTWAHETALVSSGAIAFSLSSDASRAVVAGSSSTSVYLRSGSTWAIERTFSGYTGDAPMLSGTGSRLALRSASSARVSLADRSGTTWATTSFANVYVGRISPDGTRLASGGDIYRVAPPLGLGVACTADDQCASDYCVDGVCCQSSCGSGSTADCQACATALTGMPNGTCAALSAAVAPTITCRVSAGACDLAEQCVATSINCPTNVFRSAMYECRAADASQLCDTPEFCPGNAAACPAAGTSPPRPSGTVCRASAGACDPEERCDGSSYACPGNVLSPSGTSCGSGGGGCTVGGTCNGTSATCPAATLRPSGHVCRPRDTANPCDADDTCDGTTDVCHENHAPSTTPCGPAVSGACDAPDYCAGTGAYCVASYLSSTVCRPSAGACDIAEVCTGAGPTCPPDGRLSAGVLCRDAIGGCDVAEYCNGGAACPDDTFRPLGAGCRPATTPCDVAEACTGTSADCPNDGFAAEGTVCNGFLLGPCDEADVCNGLDGICQPLYRSDIVCRPAAGSCDVDESCTGGSAQCPPDSFLAAGEACGSAGGSCATPGTCSGTAASCPGATLLAAGTVCNAADPSVPCDADDVCTGSSDLCPPTFRPAGTECSASSGEVCDAPDVCAGTSADCVPTYLSGVQCRESSGACDAPEYCGGTTANCPPDVVQSAGISCRASTSSCDPEEVCDGVSSLCPQDTLECDAGAPVVDAGGAEQDAGETSRDGGPTPGSDAGMPIATEGCACRAGAPRGGGGWPPLAILGIVVAVAAHTSRRRR
jgi:hypothetical protein